MQLVVVDEEHDNRVGPVKPDKGPFFTFEDVLQGSTLFTKNPQAGYVPSSGDFYLYENLFFRDPEGKDIGSPCQTLDFKYEFRDWTKDGVFWGVIRPTGGFMVSPNRCHAKVTVRMEWHGQEYRKEFVVPLNSQPYRIVDVPDLPDALWDGRPAIPHTPVTLMPPQDRHRHELLWPEPVVLQTVRDDRGTRQGLRF